MTADPGETPAALNADEPAAAEPAAAHVGPAEHAVAAEDGAGAEPSEAAPAAAPVAGMPHEQLVPAAGPAVLGPEDEPTDRPLAAATTEPTGRAILPRATGSRPSPPPTSSTTDERTV